MTRLPEWRYHIRRTVALLILASLAIGAMELLGITLNDFPTGY